MRQAIRITGAVLVGSGVLGLAWALVVWQWQDPITALYTTYQQHGLAESYDRTFDAYVAPAVPAAHHVVDVQAAAHATGLTAPASPRQDLLSDGRPFGLTRCPTPARSRSPGASRPTRAQADRRSPS